MYGFSIENRLNELRKILLEKNIDTFMVLVQENRRYLSGFTGEDTQFDESAGALFITQSELILATDSRYMQQAEIEAPLYEVISYKKGLIKELPNIFSVLKTKRLGFESIRISYLQHQKIIEHLKSVGLQVELVPTQNNVENLRVIKKREEINEIKRALFIAESAFKNFVDNVLTLEMTEKQTAWELEKAMRSAGADSLSFPVIAASGPNSALPHAIPSERNLQKGEPILFDWGVKLNGYCSDISRTLIMGKPDNIFKKVYQTVRDAQSMAIDAIKPEVSSKAIDKIARDHIDKMGFKNKFGHGLGHGVGLAVHELPRISPLHNVTLKTGMVFTVEPGIYIPNWGGVRLENMVAVSKDGADVLNSDNF